MDFYQSKQSVKNGWQIIALVAFIVASVFFSVSAFKTPQYQAEVSILVIQKQVENKTDVFSTVKSIEYLSDVLSQIVFTDSFIADIESAPFAVNLALAKEGERRKKQWEKKVEVKKINNTGIIEVRVFDKNRKEVKSIAQSIAWALSNKGMKYHGGGEQIRIKLIDGPIISIYPTRPNLWINALYGLIIGLLGATAWIYFLGGKNWKINKKSKKKAEENKASINLKLGNKLEEEYPQNLDEIEKSATMADQPYEIVTEQENSRKAKRRKKSSAPANLPIFKEETLKREESEVELPEGSASNVANGYTSEREEMTEPSEEEVKERLNRLLKGDL